METGCKCHGVSGSCTTKTCWTTLPPFRKIGNYVMKKYQKTKLVTALKAKRNKVPSFLIIKRSKNKHTKARPCFCVLMGIIASATTHKVTTVSSGGSSIASSPNSP
jgi:hypothetical protein